MKRRVCALRAVFLFASALPALAFAQYKWVDDSGQVVYSDRPPATARSGVQVLRGSVAIPMPAGSVPAARSGPSDATTSPADMAAADKTESERGAADKSEPGKQAKGRASSGVHDFDPQILGQLRPAKIAPLLPSEI